MMIRIGLVLFFLGFAPWAMGQNQAKLDSLFYPGKAVKQITNSELEEVSGIAFSQVHPNLIYAHVDSGGEPEVFLLDSLGNELGRIRLEHATNRDWEDIAVGPGPDGNSTVFVAEIGDNLGVHDQIRIYLFPEPSKIEKNGVVNPQIIELTYPGGPRDAETLMSDPISGNLYLVSKREEKNRLFCVPKSAFTTGTGILEPLFEFDFTSSVAGDISRDGSQLLIKNYGMVYYWTRNAGESIEAAFSRKPVRLPYVPEPQGEAIAFNPSGTAYFTISEKRFGINPTLYRYSKK